MSYKCSATCLKFSSVAILMLFFQHLHAQSLSDLDIIAAEKSKNYKTDAVLMVATKDTVIYQKDTKQFSATRGQAPIGYSSQLLTVALVMALVDEGKISLDDKVSQYLPIFTKYGKNYITLRHCLTHFTGIQAANSGALKLVEKKRFASLEEEVNNYAAKEIQTNPGTEFRYSKIGLGIAARILEIVSKKKFDMLAQQRLFRPLGMRQTTFSMLDGSAIDPSAGARSTAADYIRFLTMLLNNGLYKGQRILSEAAVKELRQIQTAPQSIKGNPQLTAGYAYTVGTWAPEQRPGGKEASSLAAPSFGGTVPVVDFCRGYAFILLLKDLDDEKKDNAYQQIKEVLDERFKCRE